MTSFPIISRLQNDIHVRMIDVQASYTMDQVALACARPAIDIDVRHPKPGASLRVRRTTTTDDAPALPRDMTVGEAGIAPFACIDVFVE